MPEETGTTAMTRAICGCESCKKGRGESHKLSYGIVHGYRDEPVGGWQPRMTTEERVTGANPYFMGVELETSMPTVQRFRDPEPYIYDYADRDDYVVARDAWCVRRDAFEIRAAITPPITDAEAATMKRPVSAWIAKHDGSVTGPEFASQPASLAWWYSHKADIEEMFTMLLHAGLRSHEGDTCGLHVNISNSAFTSRKHLDRFAELVAANKSWSRRMAQRTLNSMSWGKLDVSHMTDAHERYQWADNVTSYGSCQRDRYSALNANNDGRIEFRLPRGTLRVDRFYKNLEWTAAMIAFATPVTGGTHMNPSEFTRWVLKQEGYTYLKAFIEEKFAARVEAAEAAEVEV